MSVYKSTCRYALAVVLAATLLPSPASARGPEVGCVRCIVVDEEGTVLFARNPRDRYPNASTTKMVVAILVSRAEPPATVTVSSTAGAVGGGGMDLSAGETYSVDALMYAMLLDSSNEAATALAEHVGGSAAEFVGQMNRYVKQIGARRTHFVNPHGLDAEGHYSSAADLALIGAELLEDPYLAQIVATSSTTIATPDGPVRVENRNLLLEGYEGAIGIKTGRTLGAGNVLVSAAERKGKRLIAVVMNTYDSFADSAALLDFGFAKLRRLELRGTLVEDGVEVGELVFDSGTIPVVAGAGLEGRLPAEPDNLEVSYIASHRARLPIEEGDVIGTVRVATERGLVGSVPALAGASVDIEDAAPWWASPVVGLVRAFGSVVS